jgi:hypothetical protein
VPPPPSPGPCPAFNEEAVTGIGITARKEWAERKALVLSNHDRSAFVPSSCSQTSLLPFFPPSLLPSPRTLICEQRQDLPPTPRDPAFQNPPVRQQWEKGGKKKRGSTPDDAFPLLASPPPYASLVQSLNAQTSRPFVSIGGPPRLTG